MANQVNNSVKGSTAQLSWTDDELVIEHRRSSARVVGQATAQVPWTKVLGARVIGGFSQFVQIDIDGHVAPKSRGQDLWSFAAGTKARAIQVVEVITARAACQEQTPGLPDEAAPRLTNPLRAAAAADPEIARQLEISARWLSLSARLEIATLVLPMLFGFLVFAVMVVVLAFVLL